MLKQKLEKRRHFRFSSHIPIEYKQMGQRTLYKGALSQDISKSGACMLIHEFVSPQTKLHTSLSLPSRIPPVKAVSRVVWTRKVPFGDAYHLGVEFVDIARNASQTIEEFVELSRSIQGL